MNLDFTDEQTLLRDSVARFVANQYGLTRRNELAKGRTGYSAENWRAMGELGWLALPFADADGGFGGTALDTMIVMEEFGRGLVLEPFLASIVLGGGAVRRGGVALRQRVLPAVLEGSAQLAFAHGEAQARFDLEFVATTAVAHGDRFVLSGNKSLVLNAGTATQLVVSARTAGARDSTQGITLFLVDAKAEGVDIHAYPTIDGGRAADVALRNVSVGRDAVIGEIGGGFDIVRAVAADAILALAAEAVGAMDILYRDTVEYTQQRVQFDHPLSGFQVLQHRMVDMFTEYELVRSLLYRATLEAVQGAPQSQATIHALKYLVGKAGAFIGESAVQLHGGMGMTEELRIGHYFKRLVAIDLLFGNADHHLRKFAAGDATTLALRS